MGTLFDLSKVDWVWCDEVAQQNLVKMVCDLWMLKIYSFKQLAEKMHLGESTVRDYINRGVRLGWCDYDPKHWIPARCRSVRVINTFSGEEYFFDSLDKCAAGMANICGHRVAEETIKKHSENKSLYIGFIFEVTKSTIQN